MIMSRNGLALACVGALALAGCASGGGGGGGAGGPDENEFTRSAELFLTQAQSLGMPERYQDALDAAMNSIADDSMNAAGYFLAARAHVGLENYADADAHFNQALDLYPGYEQDIRVEREQAWINLFNAAIGPLDAGDAEEGIRILEAAESIFTRQRPEALINLGVTYTNAGRPEDAVEAYEAALEVINGPRGAEADSATAENWQGRVQSVTINRATLLSQMERYDEAVAAYEAYMADNPTDMAAMSNLAAVLTQAGRDEDAQVMYDDLLNAPGLGLREYMNIGVGLYQAEDFVRAAEAFSRIVEVAPENRDGLFNLAQSLYEGEDWEALIPVGEQLVELDGHNYDSYLILSRAHLMLGDSETAQGIYDQGEGLSFRLSNSQLQPRTDGATLTGELHNISLEEGAMVEITVHFNGMDGADIGTTQLRIEAPPADVIQPFRADFDSEEDVVGYYYEVTSPM